MHIPFQERKARASLPFIRFMQSHIPLTAAHWLLRQGMARVRLPADVARETIQADGVPCEWLTPLGFQPDAALLYLHGGGFVYGLTPPHLQMGAYLARRMGTRVLMVEYRTAPEHPFPAALEDCESAYGWLRKQGIKTQKFAVAGDSAGGNLTLTLLMRLRDKHQPLPAAAACLSPVTDLTPGKKAPAWFKDPLLPSKAVKFYTQSYIGEHDPNQPLISPVFGDLRGLPPLLVHVGEQEVLREDAIRLCAAAQSAGVEAHLEVYDRMWHVWQINLRLSQAVQSLDEIAGFLTTRMGLECAKEK